MCVRMSLNKRDLLIKSVCIDNKGVCYKKLGKNFIMVERVMEKLDNGINGPIHHVNMIIPVPLVVRITTLMLIGKFQKLVILKCRKFIES